MFQIYPKADLPWIYLSRTARWLVPQSNKYISQVSCSALQTEWEKNICPNISLLQNQPEFETDPKAYAKNEKWNSCQDQETFAFQFLHFDTSS